jgi:hypothetical protein
MNRTLGSLLVAMGLLGCGSAPKVIPTLSISSPSNNATVNASATNQVAINFSTNYMLRTPGQCQGLDTCGHIYLLVDSSTCNQQDKGYNAIALTSPVQADLSRCPMVKGSHTITLELRNDDGSLVTDLIGGQITTKITITVQ